MSQLLEKLKEYYLTARKREIQWHDYYPNNMPGNGKEGIYAYFWFQGEDKFEFVKYTIQYMSRCDEEGMSHPGEGVKYYVLHQLDKEYDRMLKIPAPSNDDGILFREDVPEGEFHPDIVNDFGRFRYVFDDEETAKKVAANEFLHRIYPYMYILSEEEGKEWNQFIEEQEGSAS